MRTALAFIIAAFSYFSPPLLHAQGNQWIWVGGDTTTNANAHYGTKGVPANSNWPGPRSFSSNWKDASGNVWVFGGVGYDAAGVQGFLNDLWKYDTQSAMWTWISGDSLVNIRSVYQSSGSSLSLTAPGSRGRCASWTDSQGNLWLFGGYGYADVNSLRWFNDLWKYSPSANEWTWLRGDTISTSSAASYGVRGVAAPGNNPGSRLSPAYWKDANDNFWLFGGQGDGYRNDVWKYSVAGNEWTWMSGDSIANMPHACGMQGIASASNTPGARVSSMSWADNAGNAWLFGGNAPFTTQTNTYADLWKYNMTTYEWTWVKGDSAPNTTANYGIRGSSSSANAPGARELGTITNDALGNIWLFGGIGYAANTATRGYLNDVWKFDMNTQEWTWVKGDSVCNQAGVYSSAAASNGPGGRAGSIAWTDSIGDMWVFGGYGGTGGYDSQNDLWKYIPSFSSLPVQLVSFNGKLQEQYRSRLTWSVENEQYVSGYSLERSVNGSEFTSIAVVKAGNTFGNNYAYDDQLDERLSSTQEYVYYRLKILSKAGSSSFSKVVRLSFNTHPPAVYLFPNPASSFVNIKMEDLTGKATLRLIDATGKVIMSQTTETNGSLHQIPLARYAAGIYTLSIENEGKVYLKKLAIVK